MATVIDALIVTLGLDPSGFSKGQKEAASAFTKTGESASKVGKSIELSGKGAAEAISKIRDQAIELFAVFLGGKGLKDFVGDVTRANTAVGNLSSTLGVQGKTLDTIGKMVEAAGGSYQSAIGSMASVNQQFAQLSVTGQAAIVKYLRPLQAATGVDLTSKGKTQLQYWEALAAALKRVKDTQGTSKATFLAHQLGVGDDAFVKILEEGRRAFKAREAQVSKYAANNADFKAAQDRTKAFALLDDAIVKVGRDLLTQFTPMIDKAADAIRHFVDNNEGFTQILGGLAALLGAKFTVSALSGALGGFRALTVSAGGFLGVLTEIAALLGVAAAIPSLTGPIDKKLKTWEDSTGQWLRDHVPGGAAADDWFKQHLGTGLFTSGGPPTPYGDLSANRLGSAHGATSAGSSQAPAGKLPSSFLGTLLRSESSGKNIANTHQGTSSGQAQGYFQITTGTWDAFGGRKYASTPLGATYAQQAEIASKIPMKRWDPITLRKLQAAGYSVNPNATLGQNMAANKSNFSDYDPDHTAVKAGSSHSTTSAWAKFIQRAWDTRAHAATLNDLTKPKLKSLPVPKDLFGAPGAAAVHHQSINNSKQSNLTNSSEVHINSMTVNTQATNANQMVSDIKPAIQRNSLAMHMNYGIT